MKCSAAYCLIGICWIAFLAPGESPAGFIVNGSFEAPVAGAPFQTLTGNQLTGWTITSGSVDLINGYWPAFEGRQSIDLAGSTRDGGVIEQGFGTLAGETYVLTFNYANNVDVSNASARVDVLGNSLLLSQDLAHSGSSSASLADMHYTSFSAVFTADSNFTKLRFSSTGPHPTINANNGLVLDNVDVVAVVPEPSGLLLLGSAALSLVVCRGRRLFPGVFCRLHP
jgi:choice-of-anchor C domain-containing protein